MLSDFRYEMKYEIEMDISYAVRSIILNHPAQFSQPFPDRWVNNIYFDTISFDTCQHNLDGISNRQKYRLRWYGDEQPITNPKFEIKIKDNALGRKRTVPVPDATFATIQKYLVEESQLPYYAQPVIRNRYLRSYFLSADRMFRITVDRDMSYARIIDRQRPLLGYSLHSDKVIVELKFDKENLADHKEITRYLPFRQTKHSKYVSAVLNTWSYV